MSDFVTINEVGLRDGLQSQPKHASTGQKEALYKALRAAGVSSFEPVSFVHPKAVPQMADAAEFSALIPAAERQQYTALVPNMRGYERAREWGYGWVATVASTTDAFNGRNLNMKTAEAVQVCKDIITQARADGIKVRAYVSGACACPYEGPQPVSVPISMANAFIEAGAEQVSIADTIGAGNPRQLQQILQPLVAAHGSERFNLHLHDTRGLGVAMAWTALECGIRHFDSSVGGVGGCPFAPGATGNVATEDLVYLMHSVGLKTGIDLQALRSAIDVASSITGKEEGGRIVRWLKSQERRTEENVACS